MSLMSLINQKICLRRIVFHRSRIFFVGVRQHHQLLLLLAFCCCCFVWSEHLCIGSFLWIPTVPWAGSGAGNAFQVSLTGWQGAQSVSHYSQKAGVREGWESNLSLTTSLTARLNTCSNFLPPKIAFACVFSTTDKIFQLITKYINTRTSFKKLSILFLSFSSFLSFIFISTTGRFFNQSEKKIRKP